MTALLLDTCIWGGAVAALKNAGFDVVWAGDWAADPGDAEILQTAHSQKRILVTLDKDFGELAIVHSTPHSGIVRIVGFGAKGQADVIRTVVELHAAQLLDGAIITAEPGRLRIRAKSAEQP